MYLSDSIAFLAKLSSCICYVYMGSRRKMLYKREAMNFFKLSYLSDFDISR